jgi:hypothetical protein
MSDESRAVGTSRLSPAGAVSVFILLAMATCPEVGNTQISPEGPCDADAQSPHELSLARAVDLALCRNAEIQVAATSVLSGCSIHHGYGDHLVRIADVETVRLR